MKFRSPSPAPVDALPTPPHSPRSPARPATHLIDHIHAFYQQEQSWVHQTRAALELAITKGIDGNALLLSSPSASPPAVNTRLALDAPSPASSCTSAASPPPAVSVAVSVKPDPDADSDAGSNYGGGGTMELELALTTRASRWVRRKNQMRLRLDGISSHHARRPARPRTPRAEPATRLLEMFAELVDARMESCQRISRLVEAAERKDYCLC
ncbi:hypothetical protein EIP86_001806 [Pleurotus ostreatoroseus]|nr:hypothetical protein EIP86_001806 [Pleurotus ostreatoroseus]